MLERARNRVRSFAEKVPAGPLGSMADAAFVGRVLREAGVIHFERPDRVIAAAREYVKWGTSPALGVALAAARNPDAIAVIDERGEVSWGEMDRRSNSLARALAEAGVGADDAVALMCRNHRGFIDGLFGCAKLGANVLLMNTDFAGPQLVGVIEREEPAALIYDGEFAELLAGIGEGIPRFIGWPEDGLTEPTIDEVVATHDDSKMAKPPDSSRFIVLTSGTTGTPKGAQRRSPDSIRPLAVLLSKIRLQARETTYIAAPMFHSWGFLHFTLALTLNSTMVLRRRFSPEGALETIASTGASGLVVVPVMMQRILELPAETRAAYDTSSLKVTAASGSALPGELASRWMDAFGDNLYNLYGSTEVAWATIATPDELRAAPGTAGTPPHGTVLRIIDENGEEAAPGQTGRIFVGNEMSFEGYTGGGSKEALEGLLASGDVGHFDEAGRLFVDGRDDEMIVSGGENVFPREVEDLLADHDAIDEAAIIGVDDEQFGQRLKAFVVTSEGEELNESQVKDYVKQNLARYKVPREVVFMDELPRNPTGKVLKRDLS